MSDRGFSWRRAARNSLAALAVQGSQPADEKGGNGCERFVSVLGGSSYLASYFGGRNVVFARHGWEVACGAYDRWFDRFSGARVSAASTPGELLRTVDRELLT